MHPTMTLYALFGQATTGPRPDERRRTEEDDDTVVASENRSSFGRESREICLKWVFPLSGDRRKAIQSHYDMLGMMLKAFPDLVIIDNKAREHSEKRTMKSTERSRPFEFYSDVRSKRTKSLVCIHKVRTQNSLAELKDAWGVIDELKKQKAYVRTHAFTEKEREISHIGFIPSVNMLNIPREVVKDEIMAMLRGENEEIPNFEVVQVRVDMGKGSKAAERTRAYEIQCPQRHASRLAKMMQSGVFREKPVYMPYRMKQANPQLFKNAIKSQIKILADQWVIKIQGFSPEMMSFAREKVMESWATGIVPTKNASQGEWKILVDRKDHSKTIAWLRENWMEIVESIPPEMLESSQFDEQKVVSKTAGYMENESEEGTVDTYGTILSSLYDGKEDEETIDNHSEGSENEAHGTEVARPPTFAQVTRETPSTVSQISGWTDKRNDEFNKLQEKHTDLESKFNQVTAELGELKNMLQQLLVQNYQPPAKKPALFDTPQRPDRRAYNTGKDMNTEFGLTDSPGAGELQQMQE